MNPKYQNMKFLIQKIDKEIRHDFSFTLLESIRYQNWLNFNKNNIGVKYIDFDNNNWNFKSFHKNYVPIGSIEFILAWFKYFYDNVPKPINVPKELIDPHYSMRQIINGNHMDLEDLEQGKWFVKSATNFKGVTEIINVDNNNNDWKIPAGQYQISEKIGIESEWRVFVYQEKLVGLQNYSGDYTEFPNIESILWMIHGYKSAPIAYTLDVGINAGNTFVIEVHDFFSCGLYGFAEHKILPFMFNRWFHEYLNKL